MAGLPRVVDPPEGFVVSANQRMIGTSFPHVLSADWAHPGRARRIRDLLREAKSAGTKLTRREVELLYTLAASPGRVFTRDNLLTIVWGYEFAGNYRAVDSHIKRLRAKLDAYPHDTFTIATVWGAGYKFERNLP